MAVPRLHQHRIVLAIALSALLHALLLWLPHLHLPDFEDDLHPLTARLAPLPAHRQTAPVSRHQPSPTHAVTRSASEPASLNASAVTEAQAIAASTPVAASTMETASAAAATEAATPTGDSTPPLLPRHAQLIFAVKRGENGLYVGEIQHRLDISDNRYSVMSSTRTAGLARWFKSYNLNQSSIGSVTDAGLRPESFVEEKNDSGNVHNLSASFDWNAHLLHFSEGGDSPLDAGAQDSLSVLYQLALLPLKAETVALSISNGKKLENYTLQISANETIATAMGQLRTVHLHKLHAQGESGMEIWLAMEYRLLPVKMQYVEPDGSVAATITITDIRVADE